MRGSVANAPKRVDASLAKDIEDFNKKKFNGMLSFTKASKAYVDEKKTLEEQLAGINRRMQKRGGSGLV